MKKSKFLLLGSVASLASIPFVAAKCGETKEEKKPEEKTGGDKNRRKKRWKQDDKNPGEKNRRRKNQVKTQSDKNPVEIKTGGDKNQVKTQSRQKSRWR
nr:variable surface lipoprotein [Mycoplasmopsis bovis]